MAGGCAWDLWKVAVYLSVVVSDVHGQRAFKLSSATCTLTSGATTCQVADTGDAALKVVFGAGAATTLALDMSSSTTCSASAKHCPQVFVSTSDNTGNAIKIQKCSFYKQADYSTHLLTYTFMNIGNEYPYVVKDDHDIARTIVPPGAIRECLCYCQEFCTINLNNRLFCHDVSAGVSVR
eukprot:gnl/MRDRNA2_/MRDRNA2_27955_c0_seq1.p1 gnl/MRDRNA2_/MRDRNA2_27955_c0~~gnl/MRDRNA2_/MRDRNA2_27955_c0_seq1.p1  ORF type:complete len:192 (-),score=34.85 gnl/MRDRNA2_/MRDRNA2_27955_c0_seq1:108-647(-)